MDSPALEDPAAGRAGHLLSHAAVLCARKKVILIPTRLQPGDSGATGEGETGFAKNSLSN